MGKITDTLAQRGEAMHGGFWQHSIYAQDFKRRLHSAQSWNLLHDDQQEALEMITHKIARILNGNPNYIDNWVDIAGYAQLIVDRLLQTPGAIQTEVINSAIKE